MKSLKFKSVLFALLAALLYAINMPFSKLLLNQIGPVFMASFLYLGAGIGMSLVYLLKKKKEDKKERNLTKKELPYILGMIILDILAPVFLMIGLQSATSANATLLNNFEIVATTIVALVIFKETVSKRLWFAILLITISSILLTFDDMSSFQFSYGSLLILLACTCWGFENNCTRMLSSKNTYEIVILKGIFSGLGSFVVAFIIGEKFPDHKFILLTLLLGFIAFGLSIFFYIKAQNVLGASKTSAYYAVSPFIGTVISFLIFQNAITFIYLVSVLVMIIGAIVVVIDTFIVNHTHLHTHSSCRTENEKTINQTYEHSHSHKHFNESEVTNIILHTHYHGV